jgi:hypothetical protein
MDREAARARGDDSQPSVRSMDQNFTSTHPTTKTRGCMKGMDKARECGLMMLHYTDVWKVWIKPESVV